MVMSFALATVVFFPLGISETGSGTSASVVGTVYQWSQAGTAWQKRPVPNAEVLAMSDADVELVRADSHGHFIFFALTPGVYFLEGHANGYGPHCMWQRSLGAMELSAGVKYQAEVFVYSSCK